MIRTFGRKAATVIGTLGVALMCSSTPASANSAIDPFSLYTAQVTSDTTFNASEAVAWAGDNLTCDPQPAVDGHMINPRAGVVVGEVFGQAELVAHWKCASLDTGAVYGIWGVVTDRYFNGSGYAAYDSGRDGMNSIAGVGTVNPRAVLSYPGGSPALNTWHYAHFEGWTSTGRRIRGSSPLFYVAGV